MKQLQQIKEDLIYNKSKNRKEDIKTLHRFGILLKKNK